ncbi:MAG: hypothetical protein ABIQ10_11590 [Gemmatimonadaceae bacterium]
MIDFSNVQFLTIVAAYLLLGAVLGTVPGMLLAQLFQQSRRTAFLDAAIGICGIVLGLATTGWADLRITFLNGHGVGPRGLLADYGLLFAGSVSVILIGARHARLRRSAITSG